jgi:alpha-L-fucosidase 2
MQGWKKMRTHFLVGGLLSLLILVPSAYGAGAGTASALTLWFDKPAASWEREGLPIGNGAMGAVLMGGVATDEIQFNEKTLWSGGPGAIGGYDGALPAASQRTQLAEIRTLLRKNPKLPAEQVSAILGHEEKGPGAYQNFGSLSLRFADPPATTTAYRRALDIEHAVARLEYTAGTVHFRRDYFASYPDRVIVVRIGADQPGKISFTAAFKMPGKRSIHAKAQGGRMLVAGALDDNGLGYEAEAQVVTDGGTRTDNPDGSVTVTKADAAVLILNAGTDYAAHYPDYRGPDPHSAVAARVTQAAAKSFETLLAGHEQDYAALFDRVSLDIRQAMPEMPTDQLLAGYDSGNPATADRALEALYFQYGRYLLIASSRPDTLPANLQGVWNSSDTPPWEADYHVNINLQMNYWLADPTNISETAAPFYDFVDSLVTPGRVAAKRILGTEGWTLFLKTNIWGQTGMISWPTAFWQPEAGAWLASQYYDHYRFTRDKTFLRRRAWPVMKSAAEVWLDALVPDPHDGKLVVSPSYSPEHGPFSNGAAMSQQIVDGLFGDTAQAAALVGDTAFRARLLRAQAKLDSGLRIGSWGQLQEWKADWDDPRDDHRHTSHLYALHPGHRISPLTTPALAEAARITLKGRGDGGTGWSKAWKINFWARLFDGDHAHRMLAQLLKQSTLPNLWDTHPPFQIDGNLGAAAGIAEMLLQSQTGVVHILPALPKAWPDGEIRGLKARGGVTVDIAWAQGKVRRIVLTTTERGTIRIQARMVSGQFSVVNAKTGIPQTVWGHGERRAIPVLRGNTYIIK